MKNNKKLKTALIVFIVILALVLCFNVGVYAAYALAATEVSYTKPNGTQTSVKAALDELYNKDKINNTTKEIGDEVTVGGEQFYVLEWFGGGSNIAKLISKYNLNKAGTAQINASYNDTACAFSSTNYWSSSFTSPLLNLNDFIGYKATDVIGKAKSYGRSKGAISSGLLSYENASILKINENPKISEMLYGTANTGGQLFYWLGSAGASEYVWCITKSYYGDSILNQCKYTGKNIVGSLDLSAYSGVRPVITILKSKIS